VALSPQPPAPFSFEPPPAEPVPVWGLWAGMVAVGLAILTVLDVIFKAVAARWRGILLAHIFFLTLWLAIQVFFFATGAHWCFPAADGGWIAGLSKYFPQIARCLPAGTTAATVTPSPQKGSPPSSPGSHAFSFNAPVTNCWRDRSLDGNCFGRAEHHRKAPPHRARPPEPCGFPCRRPYGCCADDI